MCELRHSNRVIVESYYYQKPGQRCKVELQAFTGNRIFISVMIMFAISAACASASNWVMANASTTVRLCLILSILEIPHILTPSPSNSNTPLHRDQKRRKYDHKAGLSPNFVLLKRRVFSACSNTQTHALLFRGKIITQSISFWCKNVNFFLLDL